jgi:hypothetical protein
MSRSQSNAASWKIPLLVTLCAVVANLDFRLHWQWQPWIVWVDLAVTLGSATLIYIARHRNGSNGKAPLPSLVGRCVLVAGPTLLILQPILMQPFWRAVASGDPLEIVLLLMLQNAAVVVALVLILWWLMSRYWLQVAHHAAVGQVRRMPSRVLILSCTTANLVLVAGLDLLDVRWHRCSQLG